MRKHFLTIFSITCLLFLGIAPAVAAQDGSPTAQESPFASLGLPELNVTITADGYEGIPESLPAGRYLVTATPAAGVEVDGAVAFVQPQGMSAEDFLAALTGGGGAPASPDAASANSDDEGMMMPDFVYKAVMAGGATASGSANIIDLTPGEWFAWADDPTLPMQPVIFNVTGEMPTDLATPETTATITLGEYVIKVTAGELKAGLNTIEVDNIGAQPHFVFVMRAPDGYTVDQATALLEDDMNGTPVPATVPEPGVYAYLPSQSSGITTWTTMDLEPGVYIMVCYFPDMGDGMPHAMHGMYTVLEVTA